MRRGKGCAIIREGYSGATPLKSQYVTEDTGNIEKKVARKISAEVSRD